MNSKYCIKDTGVSPCWASHIILSLRSRNRGVEHKERKKERIGSIFFQKTKMAAEEVCWIVYGDSVRTTGWYIFSQRRTDNCTCVIVDKEDVFSILQTGFGQIVINNWPHWCPVVNLYCHICITVCTVSIHIYIYIYRCYIYIYIELFHNQTRKTKCVFSPRSRKREELIVHMSTVWDMQISTVANGISTISSLVSAGVAKH